MALNGVALGQGASRVLPGSFEPGVAFPVVITLDVPPGTLAAAVEETPPVGWAVSNVSPGGTFVGTDIRWGPFFEPIPTEVSYDLTPPPDAPLEEHCFTGTASYDGWGYPIGGDLCVDSIECVVHADCDDDNVCTRDRCDGSACGYTANKYGDVDQNGVINIFDLFCTLAAFGGDFSTCSFDNTDIHPCAGNGFITLNDLFAVLNAFGGVDPCCGG